MFGCARLPASCASSRNCRTNRGLSAYFGRIFLRTTSRSGPVRQEQLRHAAAREPADDLVRPDASRLVDVLGDRPVHDDGLYQRPPRDRGFPARPRTVPGPRASRLAHPIAENLTRGSTRGEAGRHGRDAVQQHLPAGSAERARRPRLRAHAGRGVREQTPTSSRPSPSSSAPRSPRRSSAGSSLRAQGEATERSDRRELATAAALLREVLELHLLGVELDLDLLDLLARRVGLVRRARS